MGERSKRKADTADGERGALQGRLPGGGQHRGLDAKRLRRGHLQGASPCQPRRQSNALEPMSCCQPQITCTVPNTYCADGVKNRASSFRV